MSKTDLLRLKLFYAEFRPSKALFQQQALVLILDLSLRSNFFCLAAFIQK